jgi:AraC-like DNA-binding protein
MTSLVERSALSSGELPHLEKLLSVAQRYSLLEGRNFTSYPGLWFYKITKNLTTQKSASHEPVLFVVAQGKKIARFPQGELHYDPLRYLVLTGEARFESFIEASPEHPYLCLCLLIPPDLIAKTLLAMADAKVSPQKETLPAFVSDINAPILDALLRLLQAQEDPIERSILCPIILEEIVFRLLRSDAAATLRNSVTRDTNSLRIQGSMRYIQKNFSKALSVQQLARQAAMSPSHFAHSFRAVARVSPMRYLKQVRLERARSLLLAGSRTQEVAGLVGYESGSHFTREFKTFFGDSPASYARRFQGT